MGLERGIEMLRGKEAAVVWACVSGYTLASGFVRGCASKYQSTFILSSIDVLASLYMSIIDR